MRKTSESGIRRSFPSRKNVTWFTDWKMASGSGVADRMAVNAYSPPAGSARSRPRFGFCSRLQAALVRISAPIQSWPSSRKMRVAFSTVSFALIALHGTVSAGPLRACAQVSTLVDGAISPLLAKQADSRPDSTQLRAQFRGCLSGRNICSVVYDAQHGKEGLVAGNTTADLPGQSEQGKSSVILLVRSIPPVRNDPNQYCLISEKLGGGTSPEQWDVHGWVIAPNSSEVLPLPKQGLDYKAVSESTSLRGLAAALWFFAQRMSGQPGQYEKNSAASPGQV